jgi:hypothetical protein
VLRARVGVWTVCACVCVYGRTNEKNECVNVCIYVHIRISQFSLPCLKPSEEDIIV